MRRILMGIAAAALTVGAVGTAAPAMADPDTDFANELHVYGIYGQKDYNAWIGKIMCKRLYTGVDKDVFATARFIQMNLEKGTTTEQTYQFIGAGLRTYCPEKLSVLDAARQQ
ncbi:DUF732 domain-containing protein [Mycolicibacterium sp. 018/SC-01/001]|uniref:DUF732 domain-containing protein n=1 Tax=Mycolicibacterium sp. 018/SC-01/001 TaxID=2592069 RepID=UPI00118176C8|nr:DUF732 domain-containing protein [Mycolicibacterium sp. 018/SC-01/001]TRW82327.1 DUF732 domain-containing protein [Mycolicibacterium sp. 018/SC-01/001]